MIPDVDEQGSEVSPRPPSRDVLPIIGVVLTIAGLAGLVLVLAAPDVVGGASGLIGGLALNAFIVGPALILRRFESTLRRLIPPWLPW
ncbi:MAG: hypothetical protein HY263_10350 [Chloroflexi bacterium]|nr:hypothetical protein [Chloroflexota bacterium]